MEKSLSASRSPGLLDDPLKAKELLLASLHTRSSMSHRLLKKPHTMDPGATTHDPVQAGEEGGRVCEGRLDSLFKYFFSSIASISLVFLEGPITQPNC